LSLLKGSARTEDPSLLRRKALADDHRDKSINPANSPQIISFKVSSGGVDKKIEQ